MSQDVEQELVPAAIAESTAPAEVTEQPAAPAAAEPQETLTELEKQEQEREKLTPHKGGVQRRIDELTREKHREKARADLFEKMLLERQANGKTPETSSAPATPTAEPDIADFETQEGYLKAVRAWDREQIKEEIRSEIQLSGKQQKERGEAEQRQVAWSGKEEAASASHEDYAEVTAVALDTLGKTQGSAVSAIAHAIQYSEAGPELLYHFGQNPGAIEELAKLHPTQAVIALGRLEARLLPDSKPGGNKAVPHTQAPKPPTPIKAGRAGDTGDLSDNLDPEEWGKRFQKKLQAS